jgi:replication fork clamp-binding protein CrfC
MKDFIILSTDTEERYMYLLIMREEIGSNTNHSWSLSDEHLKQIYSKLFIQLIELKKKKSAPVSS